MVTWIIRICAIFFALAMFVGSWKSFVSNRDFANHGKKALIEPVEKYVETTTTKTKLGIKVGELKSQNAEIFFTTLDNQHITVKTNIPEDVLIKITSGADVYIEYLPKSPTTTRFLGHDSHPFWLALSGFAVAGLTSLFWRKM